MKITIGKLKKLIKETIENHAAVMSEDEFKKRFPQQYAEFMSYGDPTPDIPTYGVVDNKPWILLNGEYSIWDERNELTSASESELDAMNVAQGKADRKPDPDTSTRGFPH